MDMLVVDITMLWVVGIVTAVLVTWAGDAK